MIKPRFTAESVKKDLAERMKRLERSILLRLQYIGETFINNAREKGAYNDVTGNLRSSIGYVVLKNGKVVYGSRFEVLKDGTSGSDKGKIYLKEIALKFNTGYVLIVVAGMDYAAAVESKGKDVLTASSIIAKADLRKAFKQFKG